MILRHRYVSMVLFALLGALPACSDDSPSGSGGTSDTTPPAIVSVDSPDELHVNVTFDEPVRGASWWNFRLIESATPAPSARGNAVAPGDTLSMANVALNSDQRTVTISSLTPMEGRTYDITIIGISDLHGNYITEDVHVPFTASTLSDTTPPGIAVRAPLPGAINVSTDVDVYVDFTEPVQTGLGNIVWTSQSEPVLFYRGWATVYGNTIGHQLRPELPVPHGATQTITYSGFVDLAGNKMPDTSWSFRTAVDQVLPYVLSMTPRNLATNVNVDTEIVVNFSEPMEDVYLDLGPFFDGAGIDWSKDRRTFIYRPFGPLLEDTQYTATIRPGAASDLAGNPVKDLYQVVFTTGPKIASGSIAGTVTGDPGTAAADPTGALVLADFALATTTVTANNTYLMSHLANRTYQSVYAIKDTNGDHFFASALGDAWGYYGTDYSDSVVVTNGGRVNGINIALVDPSAIRGRLIYDGVHASEAHDALVGLFVAGTFDPSDFQPFVGVSSTAPDYNWFFNSLGHGYDGGDYYIGGFVDLNNNYEYEPGEPAGMYGGVASPTKVHIANGNDFYGISIVLQDEVGGAFPSTAVRWQITKPDPGIQRLMERLDQSAQKATASRQ